MSTAMFTNKNAKDYALVLQFYSSCKKYNHFFLPMRYSFSLFFFALLTRNPNHADSGEIRIIMIS